VYNQWYDISITILYIYLFIYLNKQLYLKTKSIYDSLIKASRAPH
jgi:hypothetical protein